jgi:hypothetical protein
MRKQLSLHLAAILLAVFFIPAKGFAQTPPNPAIRVLSSGSTGDYHFKIRIFRNESTWSDINSNTMDGDDTEEDFFPLGWYFDPYPTSSATVMAHLQAAASQGSTVVLPYEYSLFRFSTGDGDINHHTSAEYIQSIEDFLTTLQQFNTTYGKNIKAIISLRPYSYSVSYSSTTATYSNANLQTLLQTFKGHPDIFAWYVADEPDLNNGRSVTTGSVEGVASIAKAYDDTHLTYVVFGDPKAFGTTFASISCDIPGADPYVFGPVMDYNTFDVHDYNFVGSKSYVVDNKVKAYNKRGSIMVVQGQDVSPNSRTLSDADILYQTLSPIIHGARGLLYWQYSTPDWTSTDLVNRNNAALQFLTSNKNRKKTSLVNVLMQGTNKTSSTHLSNITIDGESTLIVTNATVTFNNENDLKTQYTYFRFNESENVGNVYKLNGSLWQETALNLPTGWVRTHILRLYSTTTNTVFASSSSCNRIQKTTAGNISWVSTDPYCGTANMRDFGTLSNGLIVGVGNSRLYSYNTGTNLWSEVSLISNGTHTAATVTSMLVKGSTILVGSMGSEQHSGIYRSTNNGVSWQFVSSSALSRQLYSTLFMQEPIHSLTIDNSGNIYAGGDQGHIFKSSDDGSTWTIVSQWQEGTSGRLPNHAVWSLKYISSALYAGTGDGLYKSTNSGVSWTKISGMPSRNTVWDMAFNNSYIYTATDSGVYRINLVGVQSASLYNGSSGDLLAKYSTTTAHVECRTITIDATGSIYVGTLENLDAFANKSWQGEHFAGTPIHEDFPMFNYVVKKHNGSYYIFAVNDFRPTVSVNFVLDDVLDKSETIFHVAELMPDGSEVQHNTSALFTEGLPNGVPKVGFAASFGAYQVRVFRIDVLKWSNISAINRECGGVAPNQDPCGTHAGGVTIADFDGDGRKDDFMVMWVPELSGNDIEPFRFKIGWDIENPSDGVITFDASDPTATTNFYSTGNCYGEIPGVSTNVRGGDITKDNLAGPLYPNAYPMPDIFFMGIDSASSTYRTKIGWDVHSSILNQPVSQLLYTYHSGNFPGTNGQFTMPTPVPATGGGITTYYKQTDSVDNMSKPVPNSKPEVILGHLADEATANFFHYTTSRDWSISTSASTPINYTVPTVGDTRHPEGSSPGWDTEGSGMDIGQLYPVPYGVVGIIDKYHEMAFGAIESTTQEFRYIIHNFDPAIGELDGVWRPAMTVPIRPSWYTGTVKDAGIALGDIDGDGDDDMIIMAIAQDCHGESTSQIFVRFGINTLFNEPASYKKQAEITGQQPQQPMTGERVATTLSNRPNPFNTATSVHYSIDKPAHIELEVYSMLGEVVYRVDAGVQQPGEYQMPFDAGTLSNGIYMCRLKANGVTANSVKMVIAR